MSVIADRSLRVCQCCTHCETRSREIRRPTWSDSGSTSHECEDGRYPPAPNHALTSARPRWLATPAIQCAADAGAGGHPFAGVGEVSGQADDCALAGRPGGQCVVQVVRQAQPGRDGGGAGGGARGHASVQFVRWIVGPPGWRGAWSSSLDLSVCPWPCETPRWWPGKVLAVVSR